MKKTKEDLIVELISYLWQDRYTEELNIKELMFEALKKKTVKELKHWLYGN